LLQDTYKTVHHTFSMLLHYLGKLESKFGENYTVLLKTYFILLALTRWKTDFHNSFTVKKEKYKQHYDKLEKNFVRSSLEHFMRAAQFASVSSCARTSLFEAFLLQMLFMTRQQMTWECLSPVIFHGLCCEFGQPVNATFRQFFVRKFFLNCLALYPSNDILY